MIATKVSDLTASSIAEYIRLVDPTADDLNTLSSLLTIAKSYVTEYTGKTLAKLDDYSDIVIVVMILCQDMWDNRTLYVEDSSLNKTVESILGLHSENLL